MRERLALLERFPYWPHAPRDASRADVARFAYGLVDDAEFEEHRDEAGALLAFAARQHLAWDTEQLGLRAARVAFVIDERSDRLHDRVVADAIAKAEADGYGYVFTRIDAGDLRTVQACERAGFVTVDAILSQYIEVARAPAVELPGDVEIVEATSDDAERMSALVDGTLARSRFHDDPRFGPERGRALYRTWAANCVRGLNELTLIARIDGHDAGYLTVKDNKAARAGFGWGYGRIELVGVLDGYRGRGVVGALTAALLARCDRFGWTRLGVGTQTWNVAAIRAYQKAGFVPGDSIFSMRWRIDDAAHG